MDSIIYTNLFFFAETCSPDVRKPLLHLLDCEWQVLVHLPKDKGGWTMTIKNNEDLEFSFDYFLSCGEKTFFTYCNIPTRLSFLATSNFTARKNNQTLLLQDSLRKGVVHFLNEFLNTYRLQGENALSGENIQTITFNKSKIENECMEDVFYIVEHFEDLLGFIVANHRYLLKKYSRINEAYKAFIRFKNQHRHEEINKLKHKKRFRRRIKRYVYQLFH